MSLYSKEVRQYLHRIDWPQGLIWEVVEYDDYLNLKMYRDNINALPTREALRLTPIVNEVFMKLRTDNVPIYLWVEAGNGIRTGLVK